MSLKTPGIPVLQALVKGLARRATTTARIARRLAVKAAGRKGKRKKDRGFQMDPVFPSAGRVSRGGAADRRPAPAPELSGGGGPAAELSPAARDAARRARGAPFSERWTSLDLGRSLRTRARPRGWSSWNWEQALLEAASISDANVRRLWRLGVRSAALDEVGEERFTKALAAIALHQRDEAVRHLRLLIDDNPAAHIAIVGRLLLDWSHRSLEHQAVNRDRPGGAADVVVVDTGTPEELIAELPPDLVHGARWLVAATKFRPGADAVVERPDTAFWYSQEGAEFHDLLMQVCSEVGRSIAATWGTPSLSEALTIHAADVFRHILWAKYRLGRLGPEGGRVLVLTRLPGFAVLMAAHTDAAVWSEFRTPPVLASPEKEKLPYYPGGPAIRRDVHTERNLGRKNTASLVAQAHGNVSRAGGRPVVVVWRIADDKDTEALFQVLAAALESYAVVAVLLKKSGARDSAFTDRLSRLRHSHRLTPIFTDDLTERARLDRSLVGVQVAEALQGLRAPEIDGLAAASIEIFYQDVGRHKGFLNACCDIRVLADLATRLARDMDPAFVIARGARSGAIGGMVSAFNAFGVETVDVNTVFLGNSARQIRTLAKKVAVIDTEQTALCARMWGMAREDVIPVGYLGQSICPVPLRKAKHVLFAIQPGSQDQSEGLLQVAAGIAEALPRTALELRVHPADLKTGAGEIYHQFASGRPNVFVTAPEVGPADSLSRASVVVTRSSNMGLEAAIAGIPVVRCGFLENAGNVMARPAPYAENALDIEDAVSKVLALLGDPRRRKKATAGASRYLALNPSLSDGKGAVRLVEFMGKAARAPRLQGDRSSTRRGVAISVMTRVAQRMFGPGFWIRTPG